MKLVEQDGWAIDRPRGDHRQYVHSVKTGVVTISGHPSDDVHPKTLASIMRQVGLNGERKMKSVRYAVIYETANGKGVSAYVPDLPGCVATGKTLHECKRRMEEAIPFHIEGLRRIGQAVPPPTSFAGTIDVGDAA